jgi:hypothetical protein
MILTRKQFVIVLSITLSYLVGQLVVGTSLSVAALFSAAIFFGILAVFAGGGLKSVFGCLNAVLIAKFLLLGFAIKILLFEPVDNTLNAPFTTALVMALGFAGLFIGTIIQFKLSCPQSWSLNRPISNGMLLWFSIVLLVVSYVGYFASIFASGDGMQEGGWIGIARTMGSLKSFAIIPPLLYLWRTNTRNWMTHPMILALLAWSAIVGIFSTSKQDAIEPFAFYVVVGFLRYGLRDRRLWSLVSAGLIYYALIVFPYSQFVRHSGGRVGSISQRAEVIADTFWRVLSDRDFRTSTAERVSQPSYFRQVSLAPFNRLAMVGEADKLIFATQWQQAFTGGETITWGFKMLIPSVLLADKPLNEASNYLAHIVGELAPSDQTTQVSYGIMANLYNAFAFTGVFLGSIFFFAGFYYWIKIFFGEARWDGRASSSSLWFIWLVASFEHRIVESSLSGMISSLVFPLVIAALYIIAKFLSQSFPHGISTQGRWASQQS